MRSASPNFFGRQPTPIAKTATATLTIAELLTGIITSNATAAATYTLPTGTLSDGGITPAIFVDGCFDWSIINLAASGGTVTVAAGTGHTIVGSATVALSSSVTFRSRKTAANTFVTYRI